MKAGDRNKYSWNMDYIPYEDGSGYEARFYTCGICTLMREYTLASGGPYCDCGYKKKGI